MAKLFEGSSSGTGLRLAIVSSRWNEFIVDQLLKGAKNAARRAGILDNNIDMAVVPGAFEIAFIAKKLADTGRYDAIIALGCIIRGETPHFETITTETAHGIARAAYDTGIPIAFGVLSVETTEQAIERAGNKAGNKGAEAMLVAIETCNLAKRIEEDLS